MPSDESTEELVDRIINKTQKDEIVDREIKETGTEPFRYITDEDEIQSVLTTEKTSPFTIMKLPDEVKMVDGVECLAGLGDTDAIESIIQRHIGSRKFRNK